MPLDANGKELETDDVTLSGPVLALLTEAERKYMEKIHQHAKLFPTQDNSSRRLLRVIARLGLLLLEARAGLPPVVPDLS